MIDPANPDYANTPVAVQRPDYAYHPVDTSVAPSVSIVTPFYNTGAVFRETAACVFQQSLQQWEWIIVNDGSTDAEALALLQEYRARDPRIRILEHTHNRGLSAARNTGFQAARAPYVVQLDSDDLLEPTAVEKWLWFLESYPEYGFVKGYTVGFEADTYLWKNGFHDGKAFLEENIVAATSMIRVAVHKAVGGYDETFRGGLEDWDFWLRCASHGQWGGTLPEYLDWYRRRQAHEDRWAEWNNPQAVQVQLQQRYPQLWTGEFPDIQPRWHYAYDPVPEDQGWDNTLGKDKPRLLMIVPWLTVGGADKFNLDVLEQLTTQGWEVSLATTLTGDSSWLPQFARFTPDIFILHHFLQLTDYPRFLRYLIRSRQFDLVMITNSELGYLLLPYLRAHCPEIPFVDYCHMEEEEWKNGGYPRLAVEYQYLLAMNIVSSAHLRDWMQKRGANPAHIHVCYTNVDAERWQPVSAAQRLASRQALDIADETPIFLYAARICAQKQPRVFADTLVQLRQHTTNWLAVVAGDGPDLDWLRSFVKQHGLSDHVRLLGAVSNDHVAGLMAAADIFFLPSQWEGIALSIYEAMASGLPIVGADVGGQRELVTPECGVLIMPDTPAAQAAAYAAALNELIQQPEQRRRMGHAGRQRVQAQFRLTDLAKRLQQLFQMAQQRHGHATQPCNVPVSELDMHLRLAQTCAVQAVEYTRLMSVAEELWREREQGGGQPLSQPLSLRSEPAPLSWRTKTYVILRRLLLSYYQAACDRDIRWCVSMKDAVKRTLLGQG